MCIGVHLKLFVLELPYLDIATTYTNKCYVVMQDLQTHKEKDSSQSVYMN